MASADFSRPFPTSCPVGSPVARTGREISQGKLRLLPSAFAGSTVLVPDDYRASPSIAGLPHQVGLLSGFCSSNPRFRHKLPSDSASWRTPLPSLAVPVITARRELAPPGIATCLAHKQKRRYSAALQKGDAALTDLIWSAVNSHRFCFLVRAVGVARMVNERKNTKAALQRRTPNPVPLARHMW